MSDAPTDGVYRHLGRAVLDEDRVVVTGRPFGPAGVSSVELPDGSVLAVDHFELDRFVRIEVPAVTAASSPVLHVAFGADRTLEFLDNLDTPEADGFDNIGVDDGYGRPPQEDAYRLGRLVVLADLVTDASMPPLRRLAAGVEFDLRLLETPGGEVLEPLLQSVLVAAEFAASELDEPDVPFLDPNRDRWAVGAFSLFRRRHREALSEAGRVAELIEAHARHRAEQPHTAQQPSAGTRIGVPLEWRPQQVDEAQQSLSFELEPFTEVRRAEPSLLEVAVTLEPEYRWARVHRRGQSVALAMAPFIAEGVLDRAELLVPPDVPDDELLIEIMSPGELAARNRAPSEAARLAIHAGRDAVSAERASPSAMGGAAAEAYWVMCHELWREAGDERRANPSSRNLTSGSLGRRLRGSPLLPDLFDRDGHPVV